MTVILIVYDDVVGEVQSTQRGYAIKYENPSYPEPLNE